LKKYNGSKNLERLIYTISLDLTEKYDKYCLMVHEDGSEVSKDCCLAKNQEWIDISKDGDEPEFKCVSVKASPCPETNDEYIKLLMDNNNCSITEDCCVEGFYWHNGINIKDVRPGVLNGTLKDRSQLLVKGCEDVVIATDGLTDSPANSGCRNDSDPCTQNFIGWNNGFAQWGQTDENGNIIGGQTQNTNKSCCIGLGLTDDNIIQVSNLNNDPNRSCAWICKKPLSADPTDGGTGIKFIP
jgi:hypothetical protein